MRTRRVSTTQPWRWPGDEIIEVVLPGLAASVPMRHGSRTGFGPAGSCGVCSFGTSSSTVPTCGARARVRHGFRFLSRGDGGRLHSQLPDPRGRRPGRCRRRCGATRRGVRRPADLLIRAGALRGGRSRRDRPRAYGKVRRREPVFLDTLPAPACCSSAGEALDRASSEFGVEGRRRRARRPAWKCLSTWLRHPGRPTGARGTHQGVAVRR